MVFWMHLPHVHDIAEDLICWSCFCNCLKEVCYFYLNVPDLHLYDPKWVSERLSIFKLDFPSSCEEETGSEKWHKPLKGISLRPAELICWRCKKLDYLAVLNVYFVARRQPCVFIFEPNHLGEEIIWEMQSMWLYILPCERFEDMCENSALSFLSKNHAEKFIWHLLPRGDWWLYFKWKYYVAEYTSMSGQYGNIKQHWMTAAWLNFEFHSSNSITYSFPPQLHVWK